MQPDVSAPGLEILAAYSPIASPSGYMNPEDQRSVRYSVMSGTSMACPHVAGVAAYVKSFHPDWSPSAIKSAIMTTGNVQKSILSSDFLTVEGYKNRVLSWYICSYTYEP